MNTQNQYPKTQINSLYSWPVIIIFAIFFFPVAIFLVYKRFNIDKENMIKNSKILKTVSFILFAFAVIYLLMGLTGNLETTDETMNTAGAVVMMLFVFGGGGLCFLLISLKIRKTGELYKKYITAITYQNKTSIYDIATFAGVSSDSALRDLHKMLDAGYFQGAYIDEINKSLNFPDQQTETKICKNCGASNTILIGKNSQCEYCRSSLE